MILKENDTFKAVRSPNYNYLFNKQTGWFARWGKIKDEDPNYSPFGPEILDIEITTICNGVAGPDKEKVDKTGKLVVVKGVESPCKFCYKSNTKNGTNMSLATFKTILDKMPKMLTQVAFGADAKTTSNPDVWDMMDYCRSKGVVPNITVADVSDDVAVKLANHCGAVAVSRYANKNICYDSVKKLTDLGMKQVNIHIMVSAETYDQVMETLNDRLSDPRLAKLNAIVLLSLKQKGRGTSYTQLPQDKFRSIVDFSLKNEIGIGFDSCSAMKFLKSVQGHANYDMFFMIAEPCESTLFSSYIGVDGKFYPCSFASECREGIDVVNCQDFLKDVWFADQTQDFRKKLIDSGENDLHCRECPLFTI